MSETVKLNLLLQAQGVKETVKDTGQIANNMEKANVAAAKYSAAMASAAKATSTRSTPVGNPITASMPMSSFPVSPSMAKAQPSGTVTDQEYGRTRGMVGTGAAGRDFAKQAQGLGGLVALYATFAANIFAVGAAYEALNKAAQVERLIESSKKMSTQLGIDLGKVSKALVEVSGNSISAAEAMQFTNIGASAGLAATQIVNLTKIAKGAANTLGRDVGDSVRRIIQGTAKQEQEILDELGIFLKANQAFAVYAEKFDIKVADMTGRQRTQAYADEVERLGAKWNELSEIDDPFSRFTSTGKNALNALLITINSAIKPIVALFAESESAVKSLIVLISASLAKRALPELGIVLANLFTFDKSKITKEFMELKTVLENNYTNLANSLLTKKKELATIVVPTIDENAIKKASGDFGYTRGVSTQRGISNVKLVNTFTAADISNFKTYEDVQRGVSSILKEQLANKKTQAAVFQDLLKREIISKESTYQSVVLGKEGNVVASNLLKIIQEQNLALDSKIIKEKEIATLETQTAIAKKSKERFPDITKGKVSDTDMQKAISSNEGVAATANTAATEVNTIAKVKNAAASTAQGISQAKLVPIVGVTTGGFLANAAATEKNTLAGLKLQGSLMLTIAGMRAKTAATMTATVATEQLTIAMQVGLWSTMKTTLGIIASTAYAFVSLAMGAGTLSGAIKLLGQSFKGLFAILNMGFMVVMIGITAWQLFGDSIKDFLGFNTAATKALEEQRDKFKEYSDAAILATGALEKLNKELATKPDVSDEERVSRNTREVTTKQELYNASIQLMKADAEAAAKAAAAADAKAAKEGGYAIEAESALYRRIALDDKLSHASKQTALDLASAYYENKRAFENGIITELEYMEAKRVLAANGIALQQESLKLSIQEQTELGKLAGMVQSHGDNLDALLKKRAKLSNDPRFVSSETQKGYESFIGMIGSSYTSIDTVQTTILQLNKAITGTGKASAYAAALVAMLDNAIEQSKYSRLNISQILEQNIEEFKRVKALFMGSIDDAPKAPKAIKPYTDADKADFKKLQSDIDLTEKLLRNLNAKSATDSAYQERLTSIRGVISAEAILAEQTSKNSIAETTANKEKLQAALEYQKVLLNKTSKVEDIETAREALVNKYELIDATKDQAIVLNGIKRISEEINRLTKERLTVLEEQDRKRANEEGYANLALSNQQAQLDFETKLGYLNEQDLVNAKYKLDVVKQELTLKSQLAAIESSKSKEMAPLQEQKSQAETGLNIAYMSGDTTGAIRYQEILKEIDLTTGKINTKYGEQTGLVLATSAAQLAQLGQTKILDEFLAHQNDQMKLMTDLTDSLTGAFGELGTNIGKAGEALLKMAQDDEKYSKDKIENEKKISLYAMAGEDTTDLIKERSKIESKAEKDKLKNIGAVAGATKKMFKEHTAAYKVLDGLEKASHIMQMVNMAKELGTMLSGLATSIAAMFTKEAAVGAAKVPNVLMSFVEWLGPWGVAAGAAFLASIGMSSGGASAQTFMPTAEQMQETQGTGMSWDANGNKIENGGGVFGDTEAKSNSIANSLEILTSTSIAGLEFTDKSVSILEKINKGIEKVATGIYSVPGVRSGSISGTVESATSNPGFLGLFASSSSTSITNSGIQLRGTFTELAKAGKGAVKAFETVQTTSTSSGFLNFGGGTSTNISTNYQDLPKQLLTDISSIFSSATEVFQVQAQTISGMSVDAVNSILSGVKVDKLASLRGLTGAALQEELSAVLSSILDEAAMELFPKLTKFRKFGEGFSQTVTRVIDGFDKVNLAFESIGMAVIGVTEIASKATPEMYTAVEQALTNLNTAKASVPKTISVLEEVNDHYSKTVIVNANEIATATTNVDTATTEYTNALKILETANSGMTTNGYDLSEALIDAAGGLDKFIERTVEFADRFLTEAERLVFKSKTVKDTMTELGGSKIETTAARTETTYAYGSNTPTSMVPGNSGNALWEEIIGDEWQAHLDRFGVGWDTFRTTDLERHNQYTNMLATYNSRNTKSVVEFGAASVETNGYAMEMFKTFSDGNDGIIDTKDEFKRLVQGIDKSTPAGIALYTALMKIQGSFADVAEAAEMLAKSQRSQVTELMQLQGLTYAATQRNRQDKLAELALEDASLVIGQKQIYAQEDLNKTKSLEVDLLTAQGNSLAVLKITRDAEIAALSDTDAVIKLAIYAQEDLNKTKSLEVALLTAQGNSLAVLKITRDAELAALSDTDAVIKLAIYAQEDLTATISNFGLSVSNINSILTDSIKNAKTAEEARELATSATASSIGEALKSSLISTISSIIFQSVITPMISGLTTSTAIAGTNLIVGSVGAGTNLVVGSAVAGTNLVTAGAVSGANVAVGGTLAGSSMATGGDQAATAMVNGGVAVGVSVADAISRVNTIINNYSAIMSDPGIQTSLGTLATTMGSIAATTFTATSSVDSFSTSIGRVDNTAKDAAKKLKDTWTSLVDSLIDEVRRIRGEMLTDEQNQIRLQAMFTSATAKARAGDQEAAGNLTSLSRSLLEVGKQNAVSALDYARLQAQVSNSLVGTINTLADKFDLSLPGDISQVIAKEVAIQEAKVIKPRTKSKNTKSFDIGTNYVPSDMMASIHEGERIIPAADNKILMQRLEAPSKHNQELVLEIRSMREEFKVLQALASTGNTYSKKTSDLLNQVTSGGDAMQVESSDASVTVIGV